MELAETAGTPPAVPGAPSWSPVRPTPAPASRLLRPWLPLVLAAIISLPFIWFRHQGSRSPSVPEQQAWFQEVADAPEVLDRVGSPASLGEAVWVWGASAPPLHTSGFQLIGPKGKAQIFFVTVDFAGERLLQRIEVAAGPRSARITVQDTDRLADRGWHYADAGELDKAFAAFELALKLNPRDIWAYNDRALTYASAGKWDSAFEDFDQALRIAPEEAALYVSRGQVWALDGVDRRAIEDLERAITLDPGGPDPYCLLAVLYEAQGLPGRAGIERDRLEIARKVYGIPTQEIAEAEKLGEDFRDSLREAGSEE
jgi:tetratricopeptide (TPR) repeat protein